MLKHVSYRASSTSLSRPFGNCRSSNTLQPQGKEQSPSTGTPAPLSAPNSPQISPYARHVRHHSITPNGSKFTTVDEIDSHLPNGHPVTPDRPAHHQRHSCDGNSSLPITARRTSTTGRLTNQEKHEIYKLQEAGESHHIDDDSISLKADDPLSKHRNDLRSVESLTLRGELMPDLRPSSDDSISLHSAISLTSLCRNDMRSSTTSLCASKVPVRIHLRQLRPDIEYKTLRLDAETSCRQLIEHLLQKLRLKHRDPNLFAVVLEAAVKGPGGAPPVKRRFLLEDSARPVELQQCRPRGEANFSISMRRGGVLRVRDSVLTPGSQYKSFLVSFTSTVVEVIRLLLRCNNRTDDWRRFTLHEVCSEPYRDRLLDDGDRPLHVQNSWPRNEKQKFSLVLRRHLTQGLVEGNDNWRRLSIDECSLDADVELDEHNSTCSSILTTSSNSSRSRSSISSSTASVLSLASLSSNSSSRCSFSSNSSSGVSSGSSSYSPIETPEKDRKTIHKRQLPPTPRTPQPITKIYPISVEENIQSYFFIPSDDEPMCSPKETKSHSDTEKCPSVDEVSTKPGMKRPPQPLPRRFLSFPANSTLRISDAIVDSSSVVDSDKINGNFSKSWSSSSSYTPSFWIKARGPTAQAWQNRSRSARIRSATISTPVEHMANLTIHCRSRSSDQSRLSTTTLTSQPSTPTLASSISSKSVFSFSASPCISRAQSTSSITGTLSSSSRLLIEHPAIVPLSSKLRPLSLAPNSSITFPSRPTSLLSSHSQSTSTLRGSTSSLCLTTPSPDSNTRSILTDSKTSNSSSLQATSSQAPNTAQKTPPSYSSTSHLKQSASAKVPTEELQSDKNDQSQTDRREGSHESSNREASAAGDSTISHPTDVVSNSSLKAVESSDVHGSHAPAHAESKHCPSCCRYDNCFYI